MENKEISNKQEGLMQCPLTSLGCRLYRIKLWPQYQLFQALCRVTTKCHWPPSKWRCDSTAMYSTHHSYCCSSGPARTVTSSRWKVNKLAVFGQIDSEVTGLYVPKDNKCSIWMLVFIFTDHIVQVFQCLLHICRVTIYSVLHTHCNTLQFSL